jgi:hypothetical protein
VEGAVEQYIPHSFFGVADFGYEFERETKGFMFKFIPLLSNALFLAIALGYHAMDYRKGID